MKEIGFSNYCITEDGRVYSLISNKFLAETLMTSGYKQSHTKNDDGEWKHLSIHRAVAQMYVENPDNKPFVNHIDENKLNNHYTNLEWVTDAENKQLWHDNNPDKHSSIKSYTKIPKEEALLEEIPELGGKDFTEDLVNKLCSMYQNGYRIVDIHKVTGFRKTVIGHLLKGNYPKWKHIVDSYDMNHIAKVERLKEDAIIEVCELLSQGKGVMEVTRITGLCRSTVGGIKNRRFYTKVSDKYVW